MLDSEIVALWVLHDRSAVAADEGTPAAAVVRHLAVPVMAQYVPSKPVGRGIWRACVALEEVGETELMAACAAGQVLDCTAGGSRRPVEATLIRRCCDELAERMDRRGIKLRNAEVTGALDLSGLNVRFPLQFENCQFDGPLNAEGAQLYELGLLGCPKLPGLLANGLQVQRDLDLSRSHITGAMRTSASTSKRSAIWLCESQIGGRLLCVDTRIDGGGERSIQADRMRVSGNIRLIHQFTARGELRLIGARIAGSLDLTGACIESPMTGLALDLGEAVIEGSVFVIDDASGRRPLIHGRIDMGRARIGGQFLVRNSTLEATGGIPVGSAYSRARTGGTALSAPRLSVGAELTLEGDCQVIGGMDLSMSELSSASIGPGCSLQAPGHTALDLTNAELLSALTLGNTTTVEGTISLTGAHIRGRLTLSGAHLSAPEGKTLIAAQGAVVDGSTDLQNLHATGGRLRFSNTTLGNVTAVGAQLVNPRGFSLSLHQATVKGSVVLVDGFRSEGLVDLNRSHIEGRLECDGGTFTCPAPAERNQDGHAIEGISAAIRGGIYMSLASISPSVDFTNAATTSLFDDPGNWPARFIISGFTYDRFGQPQGSESGPAWDHAARCAWLARQVPYDAGPYEQAARVFRQHGYTSGAKAILIAQRRQARQTITGRWALPRRALDTAHSVTVSYGYRPARVLWLLAILLILVTGSLLIPGTRAAMRATTTAGTVYTTQGPLRPRGVVRPASDTQLAASSPPRAADACGNGQVRCFNAVLYAIDTVVPLVSLDQRSTWYPDAHAPDGTFMQWWLNAATMLGWLLSSIFVLSLAGLARPV
jgi:hypothetical protein